MREIKFRVFDKISKELYYIDYYFFEENHIQYVHELERSDYILMQFTGLTDKNGKEIYEGDILSNKWKIQVYQNGEGTFMVKFGNNPKGNKPMSLKKYLISREKAGTSERDNNLIGNIYENPELLGG